MSVNYQLSPANETGNNTAYLKKHLFRADSQVNTLQVSLTKSDSDIATESLSDVDDVKEPVSSASSEQSCDAEERDRLFHYTLTHSLENTKLKEDEEEEDKSAVAEQYLDVSENAPTSLVNPPAVPAVTLVDKEVTTLELLFDKTPPENKSPDLQFVSILAV